MSVNVEEGCYVCPYCKEVVIWMTEKDFEARE